MARKLNIAGGTLIFNDGEIGIMLRAANGEVGQDVQRRAYAVQKRMKRLAPVKTGQLRDGIRVESVSVGPTGPASRIISDAPHTLVNELGRGPVNASGRGNAMKVRPGRGGQVARAGLRFGSDPSTKARSGWLRFPNKSGDIIFTREVAKAKGSKFMENSIDAAVD